MGTHDICISLAIQAWGKHSHHEDVDDEGHQKGYAGLYKEVLVGLLDLLLAGPVHLTRLGKEGRRVM